MTKRIFRAIFIVAIIVMFATLILTAGFMFEYFSIIDLTSEDYTVWTLVVGFLVPLLVIAALAIVISLILASRTSKRIVQPLNEIDLDDPLSNKPYSEIDPLLLRIARQQAALKRTEQIRQEFTANVSHELKTPIHTISGYAELLKNGLVKPGDEQEVYEKIYSESQRMSVLVEDIIELSHLDSGAEEMEKESVDLYMTAKNAVDSLSAVAENAGVEIGLTASSFGEALSDEEEPPKEIRIFGIPTLLYEIVYNLCDNGIKYNHPGGKVVVNIEETESDVVLSVRDNGTGIPKAHLNRIFERFYRVDKSRSKEVGGTGLGLSIVKHAAELHNATVDIDSNLGKGTTVTVTFPKTA